MDIENGSSQFNQQSSSTDAFRGRLVYSPALVEEASKVRVRMWIALGLGVATLISTFFTFWFLPAPYITGIALLILNQFTIPRSERLLRDCHKDEICSHAHKAYSLNVWLIIYSILAAVGMATATVWLLFVGYFILLLVVPFLIYIWIRLFVIWLRVSNALEEVR
ncbi:MAG: hypothetical protein IJ523_12315 [Succinivibrionaceae bacterium]|nr:hypothetical protein [Succinivibrionaceae bacterium]